MAGAPRASAKYALEIEQIIARGVTAMVVGSGVLLGDRANAIEYTTNSDSHLPDARTKTPLPIRAFELPVMLAGKEPLTTSASHALGSVSWIIGNRELHQRSGST
jgi:hypothetical protein